MHYNTKTSDMFTPSSHSRRNLVACSNLSSSQVPKPLVNASHEEAVLDDSMSEIIDEDD